MAATLEHCVNEIHRIQSEARASNTPDRAPLASHAKRLDSRKEVDGHKVEGFWRAHQVPLPEVIKNPVHLAQLESWLRSYHPESLFDEHGTLIPELRALPPTGPRRISANPHANGGLLRKPLELPDFRDYTVAVEKPATTEAFPTEILAGFLRDTMRRNMTSFRVFGPDETASNKLDIIYQASKKNWLDGYLPEDADGGELAPDGRVLEMLSEHTLEGPRATSSPAARFSYEPFIHVIDSMYNQHAKVARVLQKRVLLALAHLLHQPPHHLARLAPGPQRLHPPGPRLPRHRHQQIRQRRPHLPPARRQLPPLRSRPLPPSANYINVIVADKQSHLQYLDMDSAIKHCTKGIGIWDWASTDDRAEPDVIMACAGDIATQEALAATAILRQYFSDLKIRIINVVDLYRLQPDNRTLYRPPTATSTSPFPQHTRHSILAYAALIHKLTTAATTPKTSTSAATRKKATSTPRSN